MCVEARKDTGFERLQLFVFICHDRLSATVWWSSRRVCLKLCVHELTLVHYSCCSPSATLTTVVCLLRLWKGLCKVWENNCWWCHQRYFGLCMKTADLQQQISHEPETLISNAKHRKCVMSWKHRIWKTLAMDLMKIWYWFDYRTNSSQGLWNLNIITFSGIVFLFYCSIYNYLSCPIQLYQHWQFHGGEKNIWIIQQNSISAVSVALSGN